MLKRWPECWHRIYVADGKMRSGHLERIRRRVAAEVGRGEPAPRDWDPDRPWTACFEAAAKGEEFRVRGRTRAQPATRLLFDWSAFVHGKLTATQPSSDQIVSFRTGRLATIAQ
mgnify:CR=1 FL=1